MTPVTLKKRLPRPDTHDMRRVSFTAAAAALLVAGVGGGTSGGGGPPTSAHARSVAHAFSGVNPAADQAADTYAEMKTELRASMVRYDVYWPTAEPSRGVYDDTGYLASVVDAVLAARAQHLKVVVLVCYTPKWASDQSFWDNPPPGYAAGYQNFYPIDPSAMDDFQAFMTHLVTLLQGQVFGYECWDEPNLWPYIYPQTTNSDPYFAEHKYETMLKRFKAGVRAVDSDAILIGGSTAPGGGTIDRTRYKTSPQVFAEKLKSDGAGAYFDAFSHHPYVLGGALNMDPHCLPVHPSTTVGLSNISVLLHLFPKKPFYLTEYAFSTSYSNDFGAPVSEVDQARFLRMAFAMSAQHPQIKALFWFLIKDSSHTGLDTDPTGCYTGLRRVTGTRKPSYYVYARGNRLTLTAPTSARAGSLIRLKGRLTSASLGGIVGRTLVIQHRFGSGSWQTVRTMTTGTDGYCSTKVKLGKTQSYRLCFPGVVNSRGHLVVAR
jgi:hypothetical protein